MQAAKWEAQGERRTVGGHDLFVVDLPAVEETGRPPALLVHGYPTSSMDWAAIVDGLASTRRVVTLDLLGFGLSDKPDQPYLLVEQADLVEGVAAELGLDEVVLITHDMGDSVGGELLARGLDGTLGFDVARRVVTNGSIYLAMAHLTPGQLAMLEMPDEMLPEGLGPDHDALVATLTILMGADHREAAAPHLDALVDLIMRNDGHRLLVRINRYLNQRKELESRWTGAIERHPAPLGIVWGEDDPIAVVAMAHKLAEANGEAELRVLPGVGHFPMVEAPGPFAEALGEVLGEG
jgi:pimeloyl-ACP methyl ester carboxylesterase